MDDSRELEPGPLPAAYDPNKPSTLAGCPSCAQKRPPRKPDGWGKTMDWWDCWPCPLCDALVCNMPVHCTVNGDRTSQVCYVRHIEAHHELFRRVKPPGT